MHEGYAVILEELDELWSEIRKKSETRNRVLILEKLIHRTAEDLMLCRMAYLFLKGFGVLILTRKRNERVLIGDNVVVTVCRVKANGDVQLGFEAPPDVVIVREELVAPADRSRAQQLSEA